MYKEQIVLIATEDKQDIPMKSTLFLLEFINEQIVQLHLNCIFIRV